MTTRTRSPTLRLWQMLAWTCLGLFPFIGTQARAAGAAAASDDGGIAAVALQQHVATQKLTRVEMLAALEAYLLSHRNAGSSPSYRAVREQWAGLVLQPLPLPESPPPPLPKPGKRARVRPSALKARARAHRGEIALHPSSTWHVADPPGRVYVRVDPAVYVADADLQPAVDLAISTGPRELASTTATQAELEDWLAGHAQDAAVPVVLFRLAELRYRSELQRFVAAYERYLREWALYTDGNLATPPSDPVMDLRPVVALTRHLHLRIQRRHWAFPNVPGDYRRNFPNSQSGDLDAIYPITPFDGRLASLPSEVNAWQTHPLSGAATYLEATALRHMSESDYARATYVLLGDAYPGSRLAAEAWYRVGMIDFQTNESAAEAFQRAVKASPPDRRRFALLASFQLIRERLYHYDYFAAMEACAQTWRELERGEARADAWVATLRAAIVKLVPKALAEPEWIGGESDWEHLDPRLRRAILRAPFGPPPVAFTENWPSILSNPDAWHQTTFAQALARRETVRLFVQSLPAPFLLADTAEAAAGSDDPDLQRLAGDLLLSQVAADPTAQEVPAWLRKSMASWDCVAASERAEWTHWLAEPTSNSRRIGAAQWVTDRQQQRLVRQQFAAALEVDAPWRQRWASDATLMAQVIAQLKQVRDELAVLARDGELPPPNAPDGNQFARVLRDNACGAFEILAQTSPTSVVRIDYEYANSGQATSHVSPGLSAVASACLTRKLRGMPVGLAPSGQILRTSATTVWVQ